MITRRNVFRLPAVLVCALSLTPNGLSANQNGASHATHALGQVDFPISCSREAQTVFERGVALLHHMTYEQAKHEFTAITTAEPECAMPHWGIAMSLFHPLWSDQPTEAEVAKALAAIDQAKTLGTLSERERAYIAAVEVVYRDWKTLGYAERLVAWASAQEKVYRDYPDDTDAAAFYALARIATAPKSDKTFSRQKAAGQLLEQLHRRAPGHPGGFHYLIHAYDNPVLAARAVEIAREYDRLAPDVPHALHMPSHIFVRLGLWEDTIAWNARSANAAKQHPVNGAASLHYAHAMDYVIYAHLQRGEDQAARKALKELNAVARHQDNFVSAYGVAAARARYPLERAQWAEAVTLPIRVPTTLSWDKYPAVEAISHFARGLGGARSNNLRVAKQSVAALDDLGQRLKDTGQDYWSVLVDAQRTAVSAWVSYAQGKHDEALRLMSQAADMEDSVDKHPVTPGAVLPARELLGDMLALSNKPGEAFVAYEAALVVSPNRFRSLYGAWQTAEQLGKPRQAKAYYTKLQGLIAVADAARPEVRKIRLALADIETF